MHTADSNRTHTHATPTGPAPALAERLDWTMAAGATVVLGAIVLLARSEVARPEVARPDVARSTVDSEG